MQCAEAGVACLSVPLSHKKSAMRSCRIWQPGFQKASEERARPNKSEWLAVVRRPLGFAGAATNQRLAPRKLHSSSRRLRRRPGVRAARRARSFTPQHQESETPGAWATQAFSQLIVSPGPLPTALAEPALCQQYSCGQLNCRRCDSDYPVVLSSYRPPLKEQKTANQSILLVQILVQSSQSSFLLPWPNI